MTSTLTRPAPPMRNGQATAPKIGRLKVEKTVTSAAIVLNAVEGWGKTSLGAHAPNPLIVMARGETGFATLRRKGLVPDVDYVECSTWGELLALCDSQTGSEHKTYVFDALGGFERLCHEAVCAREFSNDWGEKGFTGFMRGYEVAVPEWVKFLQRLDGLRNANGANIVLLSHAKVTPYKNPLGPDFDRYTADCHHKTWSVTHKWADALLFGTFETVVQKDGKTARAKGVGGTERVVFTERTDAYDAKNRYHMPAKIEMGGDYTKTWDIVWDSLSATPVPAVESAPEL
jgi:AAA domain-containing protein